jgi:hypothetical protein
MWNMRAQRSSYTQSPENGYSGPATSIACTALATSPSAAALRYWWGVGEHLAYNWRKSFGIGRADTPGSARLIQAVCQKGADAMKSREWTEGERVERSRRTSANGTSANITPGYNLGPSWTDAELALLGTMSDLDLATLLDRTTEAVRSQRTRRGIATARDRRRKETGDKDGDDARR